MQTTTPKRWHDVEALVCALDPHLAKMEAGEPSSVTEAARTLRRAAHAMAEAIALATAKLPAMSEPEKAQVEQFIAEHGRQPSWVIDPNDHSDIAF